MSVDVEIIPLSWSDRVTCPHCNGYGEHQTVGPENNTYFTPCQLCRGAKVVSLEVLHAYQLGQGMRKKARKPTNG